MVEIYYVASIYAGEEYFSSEPKEKIMEAIRDLRKKLEHSSVTGVNWDNVMVSMFTLAGTVPQDVIKRLNT